MVSIQKLEKIQYISENAAEIAKAKNFELALKRDDMAVKLPFETDESGFFTQPNFNLSDPKNLKRFIRQINEEILYADGESTECEIVVRHDDKTYHLKFKPGKFAVKTEAYVQKIVNNYLRALYSYGFVENYGDVYDELVELATMHLVGNKPTFLGYLMLVDTFGSINLLESIKMAEMIELDDTGALLLTDKGTDAIEKANAKNVD